MRLKWATWFTWCKKFWKTSKSACLLQPSVWSLTSSYFTIHRLLLRWSIPFWSAVCQPLSEWEDLGGSGRSCELRGEVVQCTHWLAYQICGRAVYVQNQLHLFVPISQVFVWRLLLNFMDCHHPNTTQWLLWLMVDQGVGPKAHFIETKQCRQPWSNRFFFFSVEPRWIFS